MKIRNLSYSLTLFLVFAMQAANAIPEPDSDGGSAPWIAQFSVSSYFAKVGKPFTAQWQSAFTSSCSISSNQTGSRTVPSSGTISLTPTSASDMVVTLTCTGHNGRTTSSVRGLDVNRADHPELNALNVSANSADAGQTVTLAWQSKFSDYCELSGTNSATLAANGSQSFGVQRGSNTFKIVCKSNDGRESNPKFQSVTGLDPYPRINSLFINDVISPVSYLVGWSANAEFCLLDGLAVPSGGSRTFPNSAYAVVHRLECFKNGYSVSERITYRP